MSVMARRPEDGEMHRKQRSKNLALMVVLVGFVVLIYLVSLVRMGGG